MPHDLSFRARPEEHLRRSKCPFRAGNQLGGRAYSYSHLHSVLAEVDFSVIDVPDEDPPWGESPSFDPEAMVDIDAFLREDATRVLAVYGEWDPWTAGKIELASSTENLMVVGPGLNHSASISQLPPDLEDEALGLLFGWFDYSFVTRFSFNELRRRLPDPHVQDMLMTKTFEAEIQAAQRALLSDASR